MEQLDENNTENGRRWAVAYDNINRRFVSIPGESR